MAVARTTTALKATIIQAPPGASLLDLFRQRGDRRELRRRAYLHRAGDTMHHAFVVEVGWFGRYRINAGGSEAFTAVYMPGDVVGLDAIPTGRLPDEITALTDGAVLRLPLDELDAAIGRGGQVAADAVRLLAADAGHLREALFSVGAQSSVERLSCFMLQTYDRAVVAGLVGAGADCFRLPLTQAQLGAVTGLTSVHVNRVLRRLRTDDLLDFQGGIVRLRDVAGLRRAALGRG